MSHDEDAFFFLPSGIADDDDEAGHGGGGGGGGGAGQVKKLAPLSFLPPFIGLLFFRLVLCAVVSRVHSFPLLRMFYCVHRNAPRYPRTERCEHSLSVAFRMCIRARARSTSKLPFRDRRKTLHSFKRTAFIRSSKSTESFGFDTQCTNNETLCNLNSLPLCMLLW